MELESHYYIVRKLAQRAKVYTSWKKWGSEVHGYEYPLLSGNMVLKE